MHGEEEKTSSLIVEELVLPRKSSLRLLPLSRRQARDDVRIVVSLSKAEVNNDGDDDLPSSNVDTDDDEDVHVGVSTVEACFSA